MIRQGSSHCGTCILYVLDIEGLVFMPVWVFVRSMFEAINPIPECLSAPFAYVYQRRQ